MSEFRRRVAFARDSIADRGFIAGTRFLKRWYYARLFGYPHEINFEITSYCNLKCSFCYTQARRDFSGRGARELNLDTFKRIVDDSRDYCTSISLHGIGEPLLHEDLYAMVAHARAEGMDTSFSTNGLLLTPERSERLVQAGLKNIIISMDGLSDETYRLHRTGAKEGDLELLKENVRQLVETKRRSGANLPWIVLQFIVTKKNYHELDQFDAVAHSLGVNETHLMSLSIDDYVKDKNFGAEVEEALYVTDDQAFSRYTRDETGSRVIRSQTPIEERTCPQGAAHPIVTSDGRVLGCCKDLHTFDNPFGNLNEESFTDVWTSDGFKDFRKNVMLPARMKKCAACFPDSEWRICRKLD